MPDSDSLRTRRYRRHKRGDHSLCVRCDAVRAVIPAPDLEKAAHVSLLPPEEAPEGQAGAQAALERQAARLEAACVQDPGNAALERVLKETLLALRGPEQAADGDLAAFLAEFSGA